MKKYKCLKDSLSARKAGCSAVIQKHNPHLRMAGLSTLLVPVISLTSGRVVDIHARLATWIHGGRAM